MRALAVLIALAAAGCAGAGERRAAADDYLRYVGFDLPFSDNVYLRWSKHQMPLRVHLPAPPDGFYADPEAVVDVVRDGITDWTDATARDRATLRALYAKPNGQRVTGPKRAD